MMENMLLTLKRLNEIQNSEFRDYYLGFLIRIFKKIGMILNCYYMPEEMDFFLGGWEKNKSNTLTI